MGGVKVGGVAPVSASVSEPVARPGRGAARDSGRGVGLAHPSRARGGRGRGGDLGLDLWAERGMLTGRSRPAPMKTPRFYLEHIHEQTGYLVATSAGLTKDDFLGDKTRILAFERSLERIGEAVGRLDDAFKAGHPTIPWRKIRGLRNVVAHVYWAIDYDIVWDVVTADIPPLHDQIGHLLATLP